MQLPTKCFLTFIIFIFLSSCSKKEPEYQESKIEDPYVSYTKGLEAFKKNDFFYASKKFSEAEINFDIVDYAAKSAIMQCFSLYGINFYSEAEENLKRFMKMYPGSNYFVYANYLLAIVYFEQISDEKKDLDPLKKADKQIKFFLNKFPNSEYSIDLKFKKDLIINQFAAKELYIAKFYIKTQKWVPAINRLKNIVENYNETVFIEEALHRLVEIYYHIGLLEESQRYASILGYNYNSSEWFEESYKILNQNYVKKIEKDLKKEIEKDKKSIFDKIIELVK